MRDFIKAMASGIDASDYAIAFTGAGISAESGIPTYRGEDCLWEEYDPHLYAHIRSFLQDSSHYWNFFREVRYPLIKKVRPNKAHLALSEMEALGKLKSVITQNIDGLHQDAGSSAVIELHGTTRRIFCMDCSQEYSMEDAFTILKAKCPPPCPNCEGKLRPDVIFFGEPLDSVVLRAAYEEVKKSDFFLVVGSSLVVYPAAELPVRAKQGGAALAIINKEETQLDHLADYVLHDEAGKVLPQIISRIKRD